MKNKSWTGWKFLYLNKISLVEFSGRQGHASFKLYSAPLESLTSPSATSGNSLNLIQNMAMGYGSAFEAILAKLSIVQFQIALIDIQETAKIERVIHYLKCQAIVCMCGKS